jgi:hypothetical protein
MVVNLGVPRRQAVLAEDRISLLRVEREILEVDAVEIRATDLASILLLRAALALDPLEVDHRRTREALVLAYAALTSVLARIVLDARAISDEGRFRVVGDLC